ncbi:unnamed protein product [Nezara viridula]|uniref:Neurotransmitter-gated ion-channel transmembrane domain-containing protein n=1 Tax=Nezara viridula TaxID=85310 RepID=A0A9P0H0E4_NEZVI|nr:unnamed protein product [Nezara viridula]
MRLMRWLLGKETTNEFWAVGWLKMLTGVRGERRVNNYQCCPAPCIDITYTILLSRRTIFYTANLMVPCILIFSMTLLGFTLPHECGEKLTLGTYKGVTILLSLTVFLNMVAETMPATSDAVPLLGNLPTALHLEAERRGKLCSISPPKPPQLPSIQPLISFQTGSLSIEGSLPI